MYTIESKYSWLSPFIFWHSIYCNKSDSLLKLQVVCHWAESITTRGRCDLRGKFKFTSKLSTNCMWLRYWTGLYFSNYIFDQMYLFICTSWTKVRKLNRELIYSHCTYSLTNVFVPISGETHPCRYGPLIHDCLANAFTLSFSPLIPKLTNVTVCSENSVVAHYQKLNMYTLFEQVRHGL